MHVGVNAGRREFRQDLGWLTRKNRCLPALRIAEKELDGIRADRFGLSQRVTIVQMGTNPNHQASVPGAADSAAVGGGATSPDSAEAAVRQAETCANPGRDDAGHDKDSLLPGRGHHLSRHPDTEGRDTDD